MIGEQAAAGRSDWRVLLPCVAVTSQCNTTYAAMLSQVDFPASRAHSLHQLLLPLATIVVIISSSRRRRHPQPVQQERPAKGQLLQVLVTIAGAEMPRMHVHLQQQWRWFGSAPPIRILPFLLRRRLALVMAERLYPLDRLPVGDPWVPQPRCGEHRWQPAWGPLRNHGVRDIICL